MLCLFVTVLTQDTAAIIMNQTPHGVKIMLGVTLGVSTFLARLALVHQAVSERLGFDVTLPACGTPEHVESFRATLKLEDPFPCNHFSESRQTFCR